MATAYDRQMKWKRHGEKRIAYESKRLDDAKHEECTFSPQTNKHDVKRVVEGSKLTAHSEIHATQVHVARQQRARVNSDEALRKQFFASTGKNFDVVTTVKPFRLSKCNKTRRDSSPPSVPTLTRARSESPKKHPLDIHAMPLERQGQDAIDNNKGGDASPPPPPTWDKERASLIGIIEAQRLELKARERGQVEAAKIADKFAAAVLAFEERLVAVETKGKAEVSEMRKAIEKQQSHVLMILHALGITVDEAKMHECRPPRQVLFRKEYEKSSS
ncbi:hypothetical protein H310_05530 [Aphanomyces invadans]|uniref:Uncharacterized protein n=1 Tax=Aphanomyces invadans TaxID=157072 RepID=A0A024U9Z8_9STRA|nr:hypothetical protein H310_05530 [Aphanomyces invadans]ETW03104.1 hypothetical protein H310_05530 [Aphanomyces invadans]|eukprot:XP_008868488.1 hypothetical protein H310_05530 [Aphanomyces invadans]